MRWGRSAIPLAPLVVAIISCRGGSDRGPETVRVARVQTGDDAVARRGADATPSKVSSFPALQIAPAFTGVCVLLRGEVRCARPSEDDWSDLRALRRVDGLPDPVRVTSMSPIFACALGRAGRVHCFGANFAGELGAGLRDDMHDAPVQVPGVEQAIDLAVGEHHTCALVADGGVMCWGQNAYGQTSDDVVYDDRVRELVHPVRVPGVRDAIAVAVTSTSSCALTRASKVICWGLALHDGANDDRRSEVPEVVPAAEGISVLFGGGGAFCGLRRGDALCWGHVPPVDDAEANARDPRRRAPHVVKLPGTPQKIALGNGFGCALLGDARVACWGSEFGGALGSQREENAWTHDVRLVPGIARATDVFAGGGAACALTRSSGLLCWGSWKPERWGDSKAMAEPRTVRFD